MTQLVGYEQDYPPVPIEFGEAVLNEYEQVDHFCEHVQLREYDQEHAYFVYVLPNAMWTTTSGTYHTVAICLDCLKEFRVVGRLRRLEECLRWILHLHHGVSKGGGEPSDDEWRAALAEAHRLLDNTTGA